jgi:hypothetical protein
MQHNTSDLLQSVGTTSIQYILLNVLCNYSFDSCFVKYSTYLEIKAVSRLKNENLGILIGFGGF